MDSNNSGSSISCGGQLSSEEAHGSRPGALDGVTIMRYAPFYRERSNGGVEQALRRLNHGLLQRHRLNVLQVYRVNDLRTARIEEENVGMGQIMWIPVAVRRTTSRFTDLPARGHFIYDQTFQHYMQNKEGAYRAISQAVKAVVRDKLQHLRHRYVVLGDLLCRLLETHKVSLLAAHGLTYDVEPLLLHARRTGIPFVLINHFQNSMFSEPQVRRWLPFAAGVGSVSGKCLPDHVRNRCVNLLDAIDTEYFAPYKAQPRLVAGRPTILLPAIIKMGKGHQDLLRAASILAARNIDFQICFAGFVESEPLRADLVRYAVNSGLTDRVVFLGELSQEGIRNCYSMSSVVVLPTYSEGLGRVMLEAQAMSKPVVAYDSGGVAESFLENETGYLVKTGDVEGLADRIGQLLTNEAERRHMGERGREFVLNKFSVSAFIQRHEALYLKALSGRDTLASAENVEN